MAITAQDVQALREATGVGMMDCKKALVETEGDIQKAIEYLREKGLAAAQKKAGRIAAEGVVATLVQGSIAAVVEVNSETDFVASNEAFCAFAADIAAVVAQSNPADLAALMALPYPNSNQTVEQMQQEKVLVIGENIKIRRFARYDSGMTVDYTHMGGKIGVLVNLDVSDGLAGNAAVTELGKDIAMQIAAMRPLYLDSTSIPQEDLDKERAIQLATALEENRGRNLPEDKAQAIAENMVKGRMNKFLEDVCLVNQPYVKENKMTVGEHVAATAKALGGSIAIKGFIRFEKGEGIEKKQENFAEEIAKQLGQ